MIFGSFAKGTCKVSTRHAEQSGNGPAPLPTMAPVSIPTPVGGTPSGTCVASLATYYSDAAVWEPYCAQVGALGSCPAPMCKQRPSMFAFSKKHTFLGTSLIQAGAGVAHDALAENG